MTEDEWKQTPPGKAIDTFVTFMFNVAGMVIGNEVGSLASRFVTWLAQNQSEQVANAERFNDEQQSALRKGLLTIAAWSALESGVEDVTKAVMRTNPHILEDERIQRAKVPFKDLLAPEEERLDTAYRAVWDAAEKRSGVNRFEEILAIAELGGIVPPLIEQTLYKTMMVRNVWAHKAGVADSTFVRNAAHLGFTQGELVNIDMAQLGEMLSAAMTYAMVIGTRHRLKCALGPMPIQGKAAESPIGQAYLALYPAAASQS